MPNLITRKAMVISITAAEAVISRTSDIVPESIPENEETNGVCFDRKKAFHLALGQGLPYPPYLMPSG
jgi:hypothetical protein